MAPARLPLPSAVTDLLSRELRTELPRALDSSGTGARLASVGMNAVTTAPEVAAAEAGSEAAFRTARADGVIADVYFGGDWKTLWDAVARCHPQPAADHAERMPQNGAFLVRVFATGPAAQQAVAEVASAIAGEE